MHAALVARRSFIVTLGFLTAVAALTIDMSLPAIPEMVGPLGTSLSRGQLIVGMFMLGMAVGQIPAGLFSDRLGRMPVLYAGYSEWVAQGYLLQALAFKNLGQRGDAMAMYDRVINDFSGTAYADRAEREKAAL